MADSEGSTCLVLNFHIKLRNCSCSDMQNTLRSLQLSQLPWVRTSVFDHGIYSKVSLCRVFTRSDVLKRFGLCCTFTLRLLFFAVADRISCFTNVDAVYWAV